MISFRLSAQDYNCLRQLCFEQGIASVSEMARAAIRLLLQQPSQIPTQTLESRVAELEGRLQQLAREIHNLNPASSLLPIRSARQFAPAVAVSSSE